MSSPEKQVSPRSIEVQRVVMPEIMHAVTQNTDEYLETTMRKDRMFQKTSAPRPSPNEYSQKILQEPFHSLDFDNKYQAAESQYNSRSIGSSSNQSYDSKVQQTPEGSNTSSPSLSHAQINRSNEEWNSSSQNSDSYDSGIKSVLYSNGECNVFHWNNQSWYAADGRCLLQVRLTHTQRTCVAVELQNKGQLYLNAWILPNTVIRQTSPTDVSISVYMGTKKENYLVHFPNPNEASLLTSILQKAHQESTQSIEIEEYADPVDNVNCPQTLTPIVQCKAKLFVQTETSKWSTFGGVTIVVSQQAPSMRTVIQIENNKTKLVSAVVRSGNVEKISSKRISFLLSDEIQKTSIVYMIHLREDDTGNKIYEQMRLKNAEFGW